MTLQVIRVETAQYEYMGLYKGTKIWAEVSSDYLETAHFPYQGRDWKLHDQQFSIVSEFRPHEKTEPTTNTGPIKSDGGSSSYYDLSCPDWLLYTLNERQKEGKCYIKTEEIITALLSNDFDYGNLFKSMIRCKGLQDGTGGKAGNSVEYEYNKMIYSCHKIKEKK